MLTGKAELMEQRVVGGCTLIRDHMPVFYRALQSGHGPVGLAIGKHIARSVLVQAALQVGDLVGRQRTMIAAHAFVDKPSHSLFPIGATPVHQRRAATTGDFRDCGYPIAGPYKRTA